MINTILHFLRSRFGKLYVKADATDGSLTLSDRLCRKLKVYHNASLKAYMFQHSTTGEYAFCTVPAFLNELPLPDIKYSISHGTVGFVPESPTLGRILYDYNLPHDTAILKVRCERTKQGNIYVLCRVS